MKLEKIAQLLDLASCSNNNQPKSMSNSSSSGDILSYNMVAGNYRSIIDHFNRSLFNVKLFLFLIFYTSF